MDEWESFVSSTTEQLRSQLRGANGETAWDAFQAFLHAVDWRESWLHGLLLFHASLALLAVVTRRSDGLQAALFIFVLLLLWASERLNSSAARHWRSFASQNYFDARGSFLATLWCGPLLVLETALLAGFLFRAARLLVTVKRLELRQMNAAAAKKRLAAQAPAAAAPAKPAAGGRGGARKRK